ncbi:sugar transferase [Clostridium sp. Marseille-Q2269]|uniref:sugar transferase n=1 Tax=Clostridium sp. Marseille-Q2269 TaxID=2942205 RepID=UPI002073F5EB|nr:sugar transferase [Clostridium sp. Marseille-Q2269]
MQELQRDMITKSIQQKEIERIENKLFYNFLKRIFDLISSLCALIVFFPLFLIFSIVIKIDSKGPIFFAHTRLGLKGKKIKVYKFRTMKSNAEDLLKSLTVDQKKEFEENFKLEFDPRITNIGNFLRTTSLDELPQLLNIFIGNMSVVGPRPIVEKEIEKYGVHGVKLLMIKPGLTGLWQANGRSDTTYEERVQMDMKYIDNRSFLLDIKIIFQTIISVLNKKGAR